MYSKERMLNVCNEQPGLYKHTDFHWNILNVSVMKPVHQPAMCTKTLTLTKDFSSEN